MPNQYQVTHQNRPQSRLPDQPSVGGVVKLNEDQIAKLNSELDVVENNVHILNEILNELQLTNNSKADEDDLTLLKVIEQKNLRLFFRFLVKSFLNFQGFV